MLYLVKVYGLVAVAGLALAMMAFAIVATVLYAHTVVSALLLYGRAHWHITSLGVGLAR
jgi:hypothetical protein